MLQINKIRIPEKFEYLIINFKLFLAMQKTNGIF